VHHNVSSTYIANCQQHNRPNEAQNCSIQMQEITREKFAEKRDHNNEAMRYIHTDVSNDYCSSSPTNHSATHYFTAGSQVNIYYINNAD